MGKNVLVLGSGGREHAICQAIAKSPLLGKLYIAPGNPGTASLGENIDVSPEDFPKVIELIDKREIQILICGPEAPLALGLMDNVEDFFSSKENKPVLIGPKQFAAQLESSKQFAKEFLFRHDIPTAAYKSFDQTQLQEAIEFIEQMTPPIVLKADGLAAGKGVLICHDHLEACEELSQMLNGKFGAASEKVVIEEFLSGIEFSIFALTNGKDYILLPEAKDYKRIGEGDTGLNTGGMGAVSPVPFVSPELKQKVIQNIIEPTINGLQKDNIEYCGFIFFGLILVGNEPFVIEYNCRLGDPETEAILPRIETDLLALCNEIHTDTFGRQNLNISDQHSAVIVLASGGYPEFFQKGISIQLPEQTEGTVFHSGTKLKERGLITSGGRVFAVNALGNHPQVALQKANSMAEQIHFEGKYFRKDIGLDLQQLWNSK